MPFNGKWPFILKKKKPSKWRGKIATRRFRKSFGKKEGQVPIKKKGNQSNKTERSPRNPSTKKEKNSRKTAVRERRELLKKDQKASGIVSQNGKKRGWGPEPGGHTPEKK